MFIIIHIIIIYYYIALHYDSRKEFSQEMATKTSLLPYHMGLLQGWNIGELQNKCSECMVVS